MIMIHLNVAFLVICPTLITIVKFLIDASLLVVNKYTSNGLFRACVAAIWRVESQYDLDAYYKARTFNRRAIKRMNSKLV